MGKRPFDASAKARRKRAVSLLSHLQNIFNMKADAALNAAEEPGQVFDYSYTKQLEQLQQLRRAIAEVVTDEKHIELLEAQVEEQANHLQAQAAQALQAGREDLARTALQRKEALAAQTDAYKQQIAQLAAQQAHLEEVEQKVAQRVETFRTQKEIVKAQYQAAQAQVNVNEAVTGISNEMTEMNLAMQRAQDKVLNMQARAGALDTLLEHGALGDQGLLGASNSDIDQQLQQISAEHNVDMQLTALKQQMSGPSTGQPQMSGPPGQPQQE